MSASDNRYSGEVRRSLFDVGTPVEPTRKDARYVVAVICFAAVFILAALGPLMSYTGALGTGDGTAGRQIGYSIAFLAALWSLDPIRYPKRLQAVPIPIIIVLAWFWFSIVWAIDPAVAARRIALTTIIIWTIFALVRRIDFAVSVTTLRIVMGTLLVANYAAVLLNPSFGIHGAEQIAIYDRSLDGMWRGIMMHKNFTGPACAYTIILFLFDRKSLSYYISIPIVAAACYFLSQTGSKTSFGVTLIAVAVGFAYEFWPKKSRPAVMIILIILAIGGALLGFIYKDPLTGNFTDPRAFTGRPLIWQALFSFWQEHPWLGSGYGSFWNIGPNSPITHYATGWVTKIEVGHNGFIDLLAQTGVIGLLLAVAAAIIYPMVSLLSRDADNGQGGLLAAVMAFAITHNVTESSLFDRDAMSQIFLMFAIAAIVYTQGRSRFNMPNFRATSAAPSSTRGGLNF